MITTKKVVFNKLQQFLNHNITLEELVDWAETAMMDYEFEEDDLGVIRNIISRLGISDIKAFGLSWEDCESFVKELGYKVKLDFEFA